MFHNSAAVFPLRKPAPAAPARRTSEEAVLLHQIGDRFPVAAFEPAGQRDQQHLES
jgi:hypothetical protein